METNIENELKKALDIIDENWSMQNNVNDYKSNFIYNTLTLNEVIKKAQENEIDVKYAVHRWYNFHTSITCEKIFTEYGAIKEQNIKHKKIDIYLKDTPFDVKLTVYPKKLSEHPYDLNTREGKSEMIKWMYANQSQEGRKHLANRLFIVCDGNSSYDNLCLKSDFAQIRDKIKKYVDYTNKNGFNEIIIEDQGETYKVCSDIIYIEN